ncbi:MAG: hypothetical protein WCO52_05830 [bacterium]
MMASFFSQFRRGTKTTLIIVMAQTMVYVPLLSAAMPTAAVQAAPTSTAFTKSELSQRCNAIGQGIASADPNYVDGNTEYSKLSPDDISGLNDTGSPDSASVLDENDQLSYQDYLKYSEDPDGGMTFVTKDDIGPTYPPDTESQIARVGAADDGGWWVCNQDASRLLSPLGISGLTESVLTAATLPTNKITFKNPLDYYGLVGEPCRKLDGNACDETKVKIDDKGVAIKDSDGNTQQQSDPGCSLDIKAWKPLYYDDVAWVNNCWDAPKADVRILRTLTYLVTPTSEGGAGHELIDVGQILQTGGVNKEFTANDDSTAPRNECNGGIFSAHYYDVNPPHGSTCLAKALDIDAIDNIRVTTKITEKKRIGRDKVSYQYTQFPTKVAWQTDEGISQSGGLPNISTVYQGALNAFKGGFDTFLANLDLQTSVNISGITMNNIGDLVKQTGASLLSQLIGGPTGGLKGSDLSSTLDNFGRAYLSQQLGLLPNALVNKGGTITQNVGQSTLEQMLNLPADSVQGSTPAAIQTSIGSRYLEENVFHVTPGTLSPSTGFSLQSAADIAKAIGIGRIEELYNLPPQSLRVSDFSQLLAAGPAAKAIFSNTNADQLDKDLYLTYISPGTSTPSFGVPTAQADFDRPTAKLIGGQKSLSDYFNLVGTRTIQGDIGSFTTTATAADQTETVTRTGTFAGVPFPLVGVTSIAANGLDCTTVLSQFKESNPLDICNQNNLYSLLTTSGTTTIPPLTTVIVPGKPLVVPPEAPAGDPNITALVRAGAFTQAQADTLVPQIKNVVWSNTYHLPPTQTQADRITVLKNTFNTVNDPTPSNWSSGWLTQFQAAQQRLSQLSTTGASTEGYVSSTSTKQAQNALSAIISQLHQLDDGVLGYFDKIGQGGMGASLNLTSTSVTFTPQGQISSVQPGSGDPVATLLKGGLGILKTIGQQVATHALTTDKVAQHQLFNEVNGDGTPYQGDFTSTGVSTLLSTNGLLDSADMDRIFYRKEASQVFDRIGTVELLKGVWGRTDLPLRPDQLQAQSGSGSSTPPDVADPSGDDFYYARYSQLQGLVSNLISSGGLAGATPALSTFKDKSAPNGVEAVRKAIVDIESAILNSAPANESGRQDVMKAAHVIQEAIVGRGLDTPQDGNSQSSLAPQASLSTGNTYGSGSCSAADTLKQAILSGRQTSDASDPVRANALDSQLTNFSEHTADCQLTQSLNLPSGSLTGWLTSGNSSLAGLEMSVGRADASQKSQPINDEDALSFGAKTITERSQQLLTNLISGNSSYDERYKVSTNDLVSLFTGQSQNLLTKIGGKLIDERMDWKSGTAINLADPICGTADSPQTCTAAEASGARFAFMGQMGIQAVASDLGFPAGFDITTPGTFNQNFGNSLLSQGLGLVANSFKGDFKQVVDLNDPGAILTSLGLQDPPSVQAALKILSGISSRVSIDPSQADPKADRILTNYIAKTRKDVISQISDSNSPYWQTSPNSIITNPLVKKDKDSFDTLLHDLTNDGGYVAISDLVNNTKSEYSVNDDDYANQIAGLQSRTSQLNGLYGLGATPGDSLKSFITGQITADVLYTPSTQHQLAQTQANLNANGAPASAQALLAAIQNATGCDLYGYLVGSSSLRSCHAPAGGFGSLSNAFSNINGQALYLGLAQTWSADMESKLQLPAGTITDLVLNPSQAPEIALTIGMQKLASKIFNVADQADIDGFTASFRNAFLSANCDITFGSQSCSLDFNKTAARDLLQDSLNSMINAEIAKLGGGNLPGLIGHVDLQAILSGDVSSLTDIAVQELIGTLNKGLGKLEGVADRIDDFILQYQNLRDSLKDFSLSTAVVEAAGKDALNSYFKDKYPNAPCGSLDNCLNDPGIGPELNAIKEIGKKDFQKSLIQDVKSQMQNAIYDTLLFSVDKNIPAGFIETLTHGTDAERMTMLAQYGINSALAGALGSALTAADIATLKDFAANGFKNASAYADGLKQAAIDAIMAKVGGFVTAKLNELIGAQNTPQFMQAFAGWASSGFSSDVFHNGSGKLGKDGKPVPSMSNLLTQIGQQKLFAFGDKMFGFKPGTAQKLYNVYKAVHTLTTNASQGAKDNAAAFLITLAITTVFGDQLRSLETSLGLVPGSLDLLVGAIVDLFICPALAPVMLLQFILVNLFGVYKVVVVQRATGDGYWPLGAPNPPNAGASLAANNLPQSDFDAKNPVTYAAGVKAVAQQNVHSVLLDLLQMPEKWAGISQTHPNSLWVSQVFSHPAGDLGSLEGYLSEPAPWQQDGSYGYGALTDRANTNAVQEKNGYKYYTPITDYRAGFFPDSSFWDRIHVRW